MTKSFEKTDKQKEAISVLSQKCKHACLFGGSRSGKSFIIMYAIIIRACKEKSRHICLRSRFNHIKTSLFMDTFGKVMNLCFPDLNYKVNKTDLFVTLPNGSEIHFAGLDDDKRTEKILGKEFSTIFFNECSQIEYKAISIALTRLAEKNGLKKKAYYDENPPSKSHWSYWLFIKKLDPIDNIPLPNPDDYTSLLMNPRDNQQNIDEDYLKMLSQLPEKDKERFLNGAFSDENEGAAYYAFNREKHVCETKIVDGTLFNFLDFNVSPMTATVAQVVGDELHIHDESFLTGNSDTYKMANDLEKRGYKGIVIPDSTGRNRKTSGKSDFLILEELGFVIQWVLNPFVRDRVNNLNRLFHMDKIKINPKCKKLINDLEKVVWKDGELYEGSDGMLTHISDGLGYGAWQLFPMIAKRKNKTIQM